MSSTSTSKSSARITSSTILSQIEAFLNFTPPSLQVQDGSGLPNFLLSFSDRSVDDSLLLKKVVVSDAIVPQLLQNANMAVSNMEHALSKDSLTTEFLSNAGHTCNTSPANIWDVANNYRSMVGSSSAHIASSYVTDIYNSKNQLFSDSPIIKPKNALLDRFSSSRIYAVKLDAAQMVDAGFLYDTKIKTRKLDNMHELLHHSPECIVYTSLPPTTSAVELLNTITATNDFPWLGNSTTGVPPPASMERNKQFDSNSMTQKLVEEVYGSRRSQRLSMKGSKQSKTPRRTGKQGIVIRPGNTPEQTQISSNDIIQDLWSVAVSKDTTWMVWHCVQGNDQYARLHMGLHITALEDALSRLKKWQQVEKYTMAALARPKHNLRSNKRVRQGDVEADLPNPEHNRRKRIKMESSIDSSTSQDLLPHEELFSQQYNNWILMSFKLGPLNSPAPGFFNRCDIRAHIVGGFTEPSVESKQPGSSYPLSEALHIQLLEQIASGEVGEIYRAQLVYYEKDENDIVQPHKAYTPTPLIIKLASSPVAQKKLSHEARVYRFLQQSQAKEENISFAPKMYGCFQNVEQDVMAIVMEYGGVSLADMSNQGEGNPLTLETMGEGMQYKMAGLSDNLQDKIRTAVTQLHQLPMVHWNLRPSNILVSNSCANDPNDQQPTNEETIKLIDFDNSFIREPVESEISKHGLLITYDDEDITKMQEMEHDKMELLLKGEWVEHSIGCGERFGELPESQSVPM